MVRVVVRRDSKAQSGESYTGEREMAAQLQHLHVGLYGEWIAPIGAAVFHSPTTNQYSLDVGVLAG